MKINIITQELIDRIPKIQEQLKIKNALIGKYPTNPFVKQKTKKQTSVYIYDLSKKYKETTPIKIIPINNHINKTGTNPLRKKTNNSIQFYDITEIYEKTEKGKTAICLGNHKIFKITNIQTPAGFLCYFSILAKIFYAEKVYGFVIE